MGGDNKAGVAIIMEAARIVVEKNLDHGPIEIVLTVAEEKGLLGSKNLEFSALHADVAFVLDAEGDAGTLILKAPSQDSIKAVFTGRSAHAGVDPEKGINAIQAASKAVACMNLGRIDGESTANIGVIAGGIAGNIVPPEAMVEGEARSHSMAKLKSQILHMVRCIEKAAHQVGARVDIDVSRAYEAFSLNEEDPVVALAIASIQALGLVPSLGSSGGGSDANIFNHSGIPALNLGVGEDSVHSVDEKIAVDNLELGVEILLQIIKQAAKQSKKIE